jgi:hypothetical protein
MKNSLVLLIFILISGLVLPRMSSIKSNTLILLKMEILKMGI